MSPVFSALANGAILSVLLTAAVWLILGLMPRRVLNAATRYAIWWAMLAITVGLPGFYLPRHFEAGKQPAVFRAGTPAIFQTAQTARPLYVRPLPIKPRFPVIIAADGWPIWVAGIWAGTALLLLARLIGGYVLLGRRKARATTSPATATGWLAQCGSHRRNVRVACSTEAAVPIATGPFRPTILIPAKLTDTLTEDEQNQIGLHEATHLARRDDYAVLLQSLIEVLFALQPVVWWITRCIALEREIACDDLVVAVTGRPRAYAACLTRIAELAGSESGSIAAMAAIGENSHLTRRVAMLLNKTRSTRPRVLKARLALMLIALAALAGAASRSPRWVAFAAAAAQPRVDSPLLPQPAAPPAAPARGVRPVVARPAPLLLAQAPAPAPQTPIVPNAPAASTELLHVDVFVDSAPNSTPDVPDLTQEDFQVFDDDVAQAITVFERRRDDVSVGVILNVHDAGLMQSWRQALARATDRLNPLLVLTMVPATGGAEDQDAFLEMVSAAADRLAQAPNPRKVLIVISDHADLVGQARSTLIVMKRAANANVQIATVEPILRTPDALENQSFDRYFVSNSYVLGFVRPDAARDSGKFHHLRVSVDRPNLRLRTDSGHFGGAP